MRKRDISIDILKFFAVLLITNSHMELLYGKYSYLATGGAIGDTLFFFASGFTIFLGQDRPFGNYYKRRINRIYPTVFAWALLSCVFFAAKSDIVSILLSGGGWFVSCIMIYYVLLFAVRKLLFNHLRLTLLLFIIVSIGLYWVFKDSDNFNMYGSTYYKWVHFFIFMLYGSIMGLKAKQGEVIIKNGWYEVLKVAVCVLIFYLCCAFKYSENFNYLQTLSLFPLLGVVHYMYRMCNAKGIKSLYSTKSGSVMKIIGGLCLEVYLVQGRLFTDKLNFLFPLNIVIIFIVILFVAYCLRCLARIWSQTFKESDYDWKEVFKLYN